MSEFRLIIILIIFCIWETVCSQDTGYSQHKSDSLKLSARSKLLPMNNDSIFFFTVCGSFLIPANAQKQLKIAHAKGFKKALVRNFGGSEYYSVVLDSSGVESVATQLKLSAERKGINCFIKSFTLN